ncbi:glycosyltransferase [Bosea massiliensis]|uniref:Glycosyltransferase n=1 Tax=Bosea massiliensis TaxID=151419 RepID=A0ABW0P8A5_9HYPH
MPAQISVVTATLNRREMLRRAIDSVLAQGLNGVEHIVVDAMSTDGTVEMLAAYPHLIVIREPDDGLYDAWNKGVARAGGRIICILNSDDEIPLGAFAAVRDVLAEAPSLDMISGPVELAVEGWDNEMRIVDDPRILALREQDIGPGIPIINGRYMCRELMARVGLFNQHFPLVADRDFLLRALLLKPRNRVIDHPLYRYREHAQSLTMSGRSATGRLTADCLAAATDGLVTATGKVRREAYARWHAWAVFYAMVHVLRARNFGAAIPIATGAFRRDPIWPLRLPLQLWRHVHERAARRGRKVDSCNA